MELQLKEIALPEFGQCDEMPDIPSAEYRRRLLRMP